MVVAFFRELFCPSLFFPIIILIFNGCPFHAVKWHYYRKFACMNSPVVNIPSLSLLERIQLRMSGALSVSQHSPQQIQGQSHAGKTEEVEDKSEEDVSVYAPKRRRGRGWKNYVVELSDSDEEEEVLGDDFPSLSASPEQKTARILACNAPTAELQASFIKARQRSVKSCSFDLAQIAPHEVISTGRTIKKLPAWKGLWPPLRELFQNTIDHLGLMDPKTGRRHAALEMRTSSSVDDDTGECALGYDFVCGDEIICSIRAIGPDQLVIEQAYTFPLPPRALDTGVPDRSKQGANTAGGFGDGFKTAAVALLAMPGNTCQELTWIFETAGQTIEWQFLGKKKNSIGNFSACHTLEVHISRAPLSKEASGCSRGRGRSISRDQHCMTQILRHKGVGDAFLNECVPRLQVFWTIDDDFQENMLSVVGGDFLCDARHLPPIPSPLEGRPPLSPLPGVYVRGIWVRSPKIADCVMSFAGPSLDVNSRDRNDVDEEELLVATMTVLSKAKQRLVLRQQVESLRGSNNQPSLNRERLRKKAKHSSDFGDWLFRTPRFSNRLLEMYRDFFVHDVLGVPKGAVFVSSRTTDSKDPFVMWACDFLKSHNAPVYPLEAGSNKLLFQEVGEYELTGLVVKVLLSNDRSTRSASKSDRETERFQKDLKGSVNILFSFMGIKSVTGKNQSRGGGAGVRVLFSPATSVAFVHDNILVVPEQPLSRVLLLRILNITQTLSSASSAEAFTNMVQAIFETIPGDASYIVSLSEVETAVTRARAVHKENASFLANRSSAPSVSPAPISSTLTNRQAVAAAKHAAVIDLSLESENEIDAGDGTKRDEKRTHDHHSGGHGDEGNGGEGNIDNSSALKKLFSRIKKYDPLRDGHSTIESSSFAEDGGASVSEMCMKPHSTLQVISVDESYGGGHLSVDSFTASSIQKWSSLKKQKLAALREICRHAMTIIGKSIPSIQTHLPRVRDGFDSTNLSYLGFCDGSIICINFAAYMNHLTDHAVRSKKLPRDLLHEFIMTVTHEFAHLLVTSPGHDSAWRDIHCSLLKEVYMSLCQQARLPNGDATLCMMCSQINSAATAGGS